MKKEDFLNKLLNELELEESELNDNSQLHLTSLRTLSLMSFLDEYFGMRVKAKELQGIDSVDKLINLIGTDKIE